MLWFSRLLERRRELRGAIIRDADQLLLFLGDFAYDEARTRARACRRRQDRDGARHWSRVAVSIAKRTGREVGVQAADRYEEPAGHPHHRALLEQRLADYTVEIGRGLARLARAEHAATELHNLGAAVRNAAALVGPNPAVQATAEELIAEAGQLASHPHDNREAFEQGIYPPALERAGDALERFRLAVLRAA